MMVYGWIVQLKIEVRMFAGIMPKPVTVILQLWVILREQILGYPLKATGGVEQLEKDIYQVAPQKYLLSTFILVCVNLTHFVCAQWQHVIQKTFLIDPAVGVIEEITFA